MERERKRELQYLNARAWAGENVFPVQASLDSSMKKNTAFIKRLRTSATPSSQSTFLQEIRSLSLHKYLSEIITACYEGLCKAKTPVEISATIEVVSALHQRFGPAEFTGYLGWYVGRGLGTPDKAHLRGLAQDIREREEKERLARQRVLLRVATDLWLVGVLKSMEDVVRPDEAATKVKESPKGVDSLARSKIASHGFRAEPLDAEPFPLEVLKDMLDHDRDHLNLPLLVIFVKAFSWDILGIKFSEGRKTVMENGATLSKGGLTEGDNSVKDPPMTSPDLRQRFKNILLRYFDDVKAHIIRDQKTLIVQARRNAEAYVKSGEVFEDRQANYERQCKSQEKLVCNTQILSDVIGAEMPDLEEKNNSTVNSDGNIGLVNAGEYIRGQDEGPGIWEDEEERCFYENLVDLKDCVPLILLADSKKKKADNDEQVGKRLDGKSDLDNKKSDNPSSVPIDIKPNDVDNKSTAIANKSVGAQVDTLLSRLPEFTNKKMVDDTAVDFCFLNSKASRNRLIKAVEEVPKGRSDLLPLYSRLVATLGRYMVDVSQGLVSYLDDEFRSLQRRKQKDFLGQVRLLNVRYLAELTKFGVVPEHVIFHCLKVGLDDFSRSNIEIICNLLENCGRYLLRSSLTSPRMHSFLEALQRKMSTRHLAQNERMLIENAIYYVNPPERAAIKQKERTPLDLYIRQLIYVDLTRRNLNKIVKQIRKLHWEEPSVIKILKKIFSKPGKIKYSNIHVLAVILGSLNRYHQDFVVSVIDELIESITIGLELNEFRYNQRRISEVKYLGELYIYRMIDSPVIFDMLYKIVAFGHDCLIPKRGVINPLDLPDDYFRIRLICNILETCGVYYDKGNAQKKLDFFLTFFQYYIHTKDTVPMEIEFLIQDAYGLVRPEWKLASSFEEAGMSFAQAVKDNKQATGIDKPTEADEAEDESTEGDGIDEDLQDRVGEAEGEDDSGCEIAVDHEELKALASGSEDEKIVVTMHEDERDPEAEMDFDRELAKLMTESLDSRKFERRLVFDVPLPMRRTPKETAATVEENISEHCASFGSENTMKFSLLSKKGNRQQTRPIDLPSDSNFAVAMRNKQQAERAEQQRIKSLVLNYDLRDENDIGDDSYISSFLLQPNHNRADTKTSPLHEKGTIDRQQNNLYSANTNRIDKAGSSRCNQRARKLQLSDVDWYC